MSVTQSQNIIANIGAIVTPPTHKRDGRLSIFGEFLTKVEANRQAKQFVLWQNDGKRVVAVARKDPFGQAGWLLSYEVKAIGKYDGKMAWRQRAQTSTINLVAYKRYNYGISAANNVEFYVELNKEFNAQYERFAEEVKKCLA